jgi:hypothetical protein
MSPLPEEDEDHSHPALAASGAAKKVARATSTKASRGMVADVLDDALKRLVREGV